MTIIERMSKLGLTVGKLADAVGVDERTVSHWRSGRVQPTPANRRKLALALGGEEDDYLPADGDPGTPYEVRRLETLARRIELDLEELREEIRRLSED